MLQHAYNDNELLCCPLRGGICGYVEVYNVTTVMTEDDEYVENSKRGCRYCEEINRGQTVSIVFQKYSPCLRRRFSPMHHILRDRSLRDINAKFEQFLVDSRRAPAKI